MRATPSRSSPPPPRVGISSKRGPLIQTSSFSLTASNAVTHRRPAVGSRLGQSVAHLVALGGEVLLPLDRLGGDDRHLVDDLQAVAVDDEGVGLLGVVGQE